MPSQPSVFALGDFFTNCYVVPTDTDEVVVIDPGYSPELVIKYLEDEDLKVVEILLTHGHADHIAGLHALREVFPEATLSIHPLETEFLEDTALNLSAYMGQPVVAPTNDKVFHHNDMLNIGSLQLEVLHTPGHSPGGVTFVNHADRWAIVGDTLFKNSVGRSDFPTSDPAALDDSIRHVLYTLPDDMLVLPGHGPATTIGEEKRTNPFTRSPK